MADLSQGQSASLVLSAGETVRITSAGVATVKGIYGAPATTTTITANFADFGPYGVPAKLDLTATSGACSYVSVQSLPVVLTPDQVAAGLIGMTGTPEQNAALVGLTAAGYDSNEKPSATLLGDDKEIYVRDASGGFGWQRARLGNWLALARPVIVDTDWWTDVDDAVALRVLVWAEKNGLVAIKGVALDTTLSTGPGSLEAFLLADGKDRTQISVPLTAHVPSGTPPYQARLYGMNRFLSDPGSCVDAVTMYRTLLAGAKTRIDLIAIGYLNNLYELLLSPADSISSLTGAQLIAAKCGRLWVMGGLWPSGAENNFNRSAQAISAARAVVAGWPTEIIFSGYEVGATVLTGDNLSTGLPSDHLTLALNDAGAASGRPSWDPMCVLMACIGDCAAAGYTLVRGTASVDASGANSWISNATGTHYYTKKALPDATYKSHINEILLLGSQPSVAPVSTKPAAGPYQPQGRARVDEANLLEEWHANDLFSARNGNPIQHWPGRLQKFHLVQATSANQPLFAASVAGRCGVLFDGSNDRLQCDSSLLTPQSFTVYVLAYWTSAPSANQCVVAQDDGANRVFHLKGTTSAAAQFVSFSGGSGVTDAMPGVISSGVWTTLVGRRTATTIEGFLNGSSNGSTAASNTSAATNALFMVGARQNGSEFMAGHIGMIRMYAGAHTDTQVAAVLKEMTLSL